MKSFTRMLRQGRGWGKSAFPSEIISHGRVYVATNRKGLVNVFSWQGGVVYEIGRTESKFPEFKLGWWVLRIDLGELENPDLKSMVHMSSRMLRGQNGIWTKCWSPVTMEFHLLTILHFLVNWYMYVSTSTFQTLKYLSMVKVIYAND